MCRNYLISFLLYSFVGVSIQEDLWYSYQFESGHGNRRELYISKVDAVDKFKTQENVLEWRSLSLKNRSIALGLTADGVTVLQVDEIGESFATNETHTPMNATVFDAAIFKYWRKDIAKSEIIAVVAVDALHGNNSVDLLWFRLNSNNKLLKIWNWPLQKKIIHLNVFQLVDDDENYNILIANDRYENYTTVDWYQFHFGQHDDFWLKQAIRLESPTTSTAITSHGSQTYLSIPQKDKLRIFSLQKQNTHFVNCYNMSVGHVTFVTSFKVAFKSYIAIDGTSAGIYKFGKKPNDKSGFLVKQNVGAANLHGINYWLAIPIGTYRDEEVLIAESRLDFNTHKTPMIQVIIHHGGRFVLHDEMTCDYYGEVTHGMSCLAEEDKNSKGIKGSTFITVNDTLGVLVPRYHKASGLFVVHTEIKELKSPLELKLVAFEEHKRKIEEKINRLREKFENTESTAESDQNQGFPTKNVIANEKNAEEFPSSSPQAAHRANDSIVSQSAPIISLNMDEVTARLSALQLIINSMMSDLSKIKTFDPNKNQYESLILNGLVEVQGQGNIQTVKTDFFHGATLEKITGDIYHINNEQPVRGHKTFVNLRADELEFDTINGIPSEHLKYKTEPLVFDGDVVLNGELIVEGHAQSMQVDDMALKEEIVYLPNDNKFNGSLEFDSLNIRQALTTDKVNKFPVHHNYQDVVVEENVLLDDVQLENVFLSGNLSVVNVNGENFNKTLQSLCLTNMETFVPKSTIIEGNVIVKNEALTIFLNDLKFPQEYVLSKSNIFSQITAQKVFNNTVIIGELTSEGTINGIDSQEVVTLSKPQNISGKITFASLNITNSIQLDGGIIETHPKQQMLSKPTLLDTREISSDSSFKHLEVTGIITVGNNFNGTNLEALLDDIVYKNMESAQISSVKKFVLGLTVLKDLRVASNAINNVDVNKLIHKETEETLNINELNGSVTFENIFLKGMFDEVDIIKLDQETVKLSGEQFISSEIVFEENLQIDALDIKQTLNEIPLQEYLYSQGNMSMDSLNIEELSVENLIVQKDLNAKEANFNLKEFDETRFSLSKEQAVTVPFVVQGSRIPNLQTKFISGYEFEDVFGLEIYGRKIMDLIMNGKLAIKELIVEDSLKLDAINGKLMKDVMKLCLSSENGARNLEMNFEDVRFGDLKVDKFNDINFSDFRENLVFKDEQAVKILGRKVYFNGFEVKNYIQTSAVNDISVYNILRKNEKQEIAAPLLIQGRVVIEGDCQLRGTFNRVPIDNITNAFKVLDEDTYQIQGDVLFSKSPIIDNLRVKSINNVSMNGLFQNLIYINGEEMPIVKNITFMKKVYIENNLNTQLVDGLDLAQFKDEVVMITQDGALQYPVTFILDVSVKESVQVEDELYTSNINGVNPELWKDRAIYINKGRLPYHFNFQSAIIESDVTARYLNNINITTLIPLKQDLTLPGKLVFDDMSSIKDIKVQNYVNSKKLDVEYMNTVMSNRLQEVKDKIIFKGNVVVRELLDVHSTVNGKDLGKIVTIEEDQILHAPYRFMERAIVNNDVLVTGLVNSINVTKWQQNCVKKSSPETQLISNDWVTGANVTFRNNVTGYGLFNGLDIQKMAIDVEQRRAFKYTVEKDLIRNYQNICQDINDVISSAKKQIYSFKYLDYKQFIELEGNIEYVHQFEHGSQHYLLIKDKGCTSKLFIWTEELFNLALEYETGLIAQMVTVRDNDDVYLISRDSDSDRNSSSKLSSNQVAFSDCKVDGTNVWKFEDEKLVLVQKLNDQNLLHESRVPGTFYAIELGRGVLEYRLSSDGNFYPVQKWNVPIENAAFLEQGLKTGLAIRTGHTLYKLQRQNVPFGISNNEIVIGNITTTINTFIPGRDSEMVLLNVGHSGWKKMLAVAIREKASVMGKLDFIKIYEDPMSGKVFDKIPTFRPSSLVSLEFGENGETLLVFLENNELIQIYEYKGIEGFKLRAHANVDGDRLVRINLPCGKNRFRSFIGLINDNHFGLLEAVMDGDQLELDQLTCELS